MREKIGVTAGKLWETLRENKELNVSQLPRVLKDKPVVVYQALGWLAREDKINYRTEGAKIYVSLCD